MTEKKCENCKYFNEFRCDKGNLKNENILFEDGAYRVKCYDWEEKI